MPEREKLSGLRIRCDKMFSELQSHSTVRPCKLPVLSLLHVSPPPRTVNHWTSSRRDVQNKLHHPLNPLTPRVNTSNSPHASQAPTTWDHLPGLASDSGQRGGAVLQDSTGIFSAAQKMLLSDHLLDGFLSFPAVTFLSPKNARNASKKLWFCSAPHGPPSCLILMIFPTGAQNFWCANSDYNHMILANSPACVPCNLTFLQHFLH